MNGPKPILLPDAFAGLTFLPDRQPDSTGIEDSFTRLADYRDGGIFVTHYAGCSEWERHSHGDEVVMVLDGRTTLVLLLDGEEVAHDLGPQSLIVVPRNTWHRFESPDGVKVLTVTPQPTDHMLDRPSG
jgi:mannose-6-phosphate isomerase-like protein (cupin superfamily)